MIRVTAGSREAIDEFLKKSRHLSSGQRLAEFGRLHTPRYNESTSSPAGATTTGDVGLGTLAMGRAAHPCKGLLSIKDR